MANIASIVTQIRQAILGKDVRKSIADGIDAINTEVEITNDKQYFLEQTFENLIIDAGNNNSEVVAGRYDNVTNESFNSIGKRMDSHSLGLKGSAKIRILNILDYGGKVDGTTDDWGAFVNMRTASWGGGTLPMGRVHFPAGTTFLNQIRPNMINCYISADPEAVIKINELHPDTMNFNFVTPVRFFDVSIGKEYVYYPNRDLDDLLYNFHKLSCELGFDEVPVNYQWSTNFLNKVLNLTTGDSTVTGTAVLGSSVVTWATAFTQNPQVVRLSSLENGACYETNVTSTDINGTYGMYLKTSTHIIKVINKTGNSIWRVLITDLVGTVISDTSYSMPNGGAYGLVLNDYQNINLYYKDSKHVAFMVSEYTISQYKGQYGEVTECGYIVMNNTASNAVSLAIPIRTSNYKYVNKKKIKVKYMGDSTGHLAWNSFKLEDILKPALENSDYIGEVEIVNESVSGRSMQSWASVIASYDFTEFDIVVVDLGRNDIQAGGTTTSFNNNMTTIANRIVSQGARPVFIIPEIFTTSAVTGHGVETSNYALHAKYTQVQKSFCITNGYKYGNEKKYFGANIGWFRDNIHQIHQGNIPKLMAIIEAITKELIF